MCCSDPWLARLRANGFTTTLACIHSGNCSCLLWLLARRWFVHIVSDMGFLLNSVTMKPTSNVVWQCVRISFAASMISLNVAYWHGCLWLTDLA